MSEQNQSKLTLDWKILLPAGPELAQHAGCIIGNKFYIHGGVTKYRSIIPSNKLYSLDLAHMIWNEVRAPGSPSLSHHACVALDDQYMVLIGGWNGHNRTSRIFIYDTKENKWLFPKDVGFADGAGLSSHTATVLDSGNILVVGREGFLKTVGKHGNAYLLSRDVQNGEFVYEKFSDNTASRSGHTVSAIDNTVYIIGGRDDTFLEFHNGYTSADPVGTLNSSFRNVLKDVGPLARLPSGRKNHIAVSGKDCILIHGGETFDGKSRQSVSDMFLMTTKPELAFYKLGSSSVARASHVCVNTGDRVIFHGGTAWKNIIYGDCYELNLYK